MTLANAPLASSPEVVTAAPDWCPRSELELAAQQVRAIERFNRARHVREEAATAAAGRRAHRGRRPPSLAGAPRRRGAGPGGGCPDDAQSDATGVSGPVVGRGLLG